MLRQKLKQKLHFRWFISFELLGIIVGIGISLFGNFSWMPFWIFALPLFALNILCISSARFYHLIVIFICGIIIGIFRGTDTQINTSAYNNFINKEVLLSGKVVEDPDFGNSGDLRVKLNDIKISEKSLPGTIWVSAIRGPKTEVKRSDTVEIHGKLKTGFANFPASISYGELTNIMRSDNEDIARDIRDNFGEKLNSVIKSPESDLGMGILAGQKRALPTQLSDNFKAASLTHIVVASGYNLTILVRFARRLFGKISRFASVSLAALLVFAFACVTGFSPSMDRAALVAILSLAAWYYGRKIHPIVLLSLVAGATALFNPFFVWGDASWYMSFGAFAGVIILSPMLQKFFYGDEKIGVIKQTIFDTLSAQILVAPIIAFFMGSFAPWGLLANLLVLPIVPLAMLLTFIGGISAYILPFAFIVAKPAEWLLQYIIFIADWVSSLPGAKTEIDFSITLLVFSYLSIIFVIFALWKKLNFSFQNNYLVE